MRPRASAGWLRPGPLLWVSFAAFTFAFLGSSALGMGPDEPAHFIKAAAAARGDIVGERVTKDDVRSHYSWARARSSTADELERARLTAQSGIYNSRFFSLPENVAVDLFPCFAQMREIPASCGSAAGDGVPDPDQVFSYVGGYPPVPYVLAGIGSLFPGSTSVRWYGTRIVGAVTVLALLACALALALEATRRSGWRIASVSIAVIPTSVFLFAVVNSSGLELAGGLAVGAAVLRLSRSEPPTARTWSMVAIGAAALAVSRPLGPFWLLPFAVLLVVFVGWQRVLEMLRAGRAPIVALSVVVVASLSTLLWVRFTDGSPPILSNRIDDAFRLAVSDLWLVVLQVPAIFGWNETPIAVSWYWIYGISLCGLTAVALAYGVARERLALVLAVLMSIGGAIFIAAIPFEMYRQRYAMQARYILPFAIVIPLLIGEILSRAGDRAPRERAAGAPWYPTGGLFPSLIVAGMTVLQLVGWWTNAVRNAQGFGGFAFWGDDAWTPPAGWAPWLLLVAIGVVSGLAAAWAVWRDDPVASAAP